VETFFSYFFHQKGLNWFLLQIYQITYINSLFYTMASSMEEQSLDLTTCCIRPASYDLNEHKPKHLPCTHNFCLGCLKVRT